MAFLYRGASATSAGDGLWLYGTRIIALALAYASLGVVALRLSFVAAGISAAWPSAGIGVAALAIWGPRYWPGVFLGAAGLQLSLGTAWPIALWIAAGGSLAPLAAAWYIRRSPYFDTRFGRQSSFFGFLLVPCMACMTLSATNGVFAYYMAGSLDASALLPAWFVFWMGDAVGVLLVAPVFLTAVGGRWRAWREQCTPGTLAAILLLLFGVTWLAFADPLHIPAATALVVLPLPFLLWAAERGGAFIAAVATLLVSGIALFYTVMGQGPFALENLHLGLGSLWIFMACCAVSGHMFVAMQSARDRTVRDLERSTVFLNAASRMARVGGWELDPVTKAVSWTAETFRIHGVPPGGEPPLEGALDFYDEVDRATLVRAIGRAMAEGEGYDLTLGFTAATGEHLWVRTICEPQCRDGKIVKLAGTFQDITREVEAREALREGEAKYRLLAENVRDIIWTTDLAMNFTYISPSVIHVRGYTPEESMEIGPTGTTSPEKVDHIRGIVEDLLQRAQASDDYFDSTATVQLELFRKDGSTFPAEIVISVLRDVDGAPSGLLGITRDITERKKVEASLRESEARLKMAGRISRVGGWEYDIASDTVYWSEETFRIFERPPDYVPPKVGRSLEFYHPEDSVTLGRAVTDAIEQEKPFDLELRVTTVNGTNLWVRNIGEPVTAEGRVVSLRGSIQDITSRKRAEEHLRLLESVITHSTDAVMITECGPLVEPGPRIVFVNEAFTTITGYSAEEVLGRSPRFLQGPDTDRRELDKLRAALEAGEPCSAEVINYHKNGTPYWLDIHMAPLRDGAGVLTHFIAIERDVTERKRIETEKLELGARAAAVIENAVDGIVTIDDCGGIESANPAALRLFGYALPELLGQNVKILMPPSYSREHDNFLQHYLDTGERRVIGMSRDVTGQRKDGTTFPIQLSVAEVYLEGRRLFTGVVHDRTHEVELEEQLVQSQKLEALGTMAGGIAHDFNNIVHAMMGFGGMARRGLEEGDLELIGRCLDEMDRGADRAASLIDQILTFSRRDKVALAPLDLNVVVDEAVRLLRGAAPDSVALEVRLAPEHCTVLADATQMHQVLINLGTNAIHAMESGGGTLQLDLQRAHLAQRTESRTGPLEPGDYARLTVTDTGSGIAPEIIDRILDPFFTTKIKGKGTGLGLATVHGIVTRMRGGIAIESALGRGTTITVFMPLTADAAPAAAPESHAAESGPPATAGSILVVDDEASVVKLLTMILEMKGYRVAGFTDTDLALAGFREAPADFALAIVDFNMPGMTGIAFAHALHETRPDLPVCLATGMIEKAVLEANKSSGIREILKKPFRAEQLLATLNDVLGPGK